ncbi:MAG: hypothetical protein GF401_02350, partial [Chitinivibrionales bacterium]|nr:hypothetical protein [Chitinivibrionales bacterium]
VGLSWTASIDADAESVTVRYRTDGSFPVSSTDGAEATTLAHGETGDTVTGLAEKQEYRFAAFVRDSAGNWSVAATDARDSVKIPDLTAPQNVTALSATVVDSGSIALAWTPSASTDAESVMVRYRTDGSFPSGPTDGTGWSRVTTTVRVDTITGLTNSTTCRIGLFVKDSSGLWSTASTGAQDSAVTSEFAGITATPDISPIAGNYPDSVVVTIACDTTGASIYYTTDGSEPNISSTLYNGAVTLKSSATIKALAVKQGLANSPIASQSYSVTQQFAQTPGTASKIVLDKGDSLSVPADACTSSVTIGVEYIAPADVPGHLEGQMIDKAFDLSPDGLHFNSPLVMNVSYDSAQLASTGTAPSALHGYWYNDSLLQWEGIESEVDSINKTITLYIKHFSIFSAGTGVAMPVFSMPEGTYDSAITVEITCVTTETSIYYTTDGTDPDESSTLYEGPVTVDGSTTLKAKAFKPGLAASYISTAQYNINIRPEPATGLTTTASSCSSVTVSWIPSSSNDAESTQVCASLTAAPTAPGAGEIITTVDVSSTTAEPAVSPTNGAQLYLAVFVRDTDGNWSPGAADTVTLGDCIAPVNKLNVSLATVGDSAIACTLTTDSTLLGDADRIYIAWNAGSKVTDLTSGFIREYTDTTFIVPNTSAPGYWYFATVLEDAAGNRSAWNHDSVEIKNIPPILVASPDTSVYEDDIWNHSLSAHDPNADEITFGIAGGPSTLTINAATLSWTPGDEDVGKNTVVVKCSDVRGGIALDTFVVTVIDRNDPPTTVLQSKAVKYGAARFTVTAKDDYDSVFTFVTSMVSLNDSTEVMPKKNVSGTYEYYPLYDGNYVFSSYAVDSDNLIDSTPVGETFTVTGATSHRFYDTTGWHMISIPSAGYNADSIKAGGYLATWDESSMPRDIYNYYKPSKEIASVEAGKGYWRKSVNPSNVSLAGTYTDDSGSVVSSLTRPEPVDTPLTVLISKDKYGWNQIGCPYTYPVRWDHGSTLWKWEPATQDFVEAGNVLEPWQGYWMLADSSQRLTIDNTPAFTTRSLAKKAKTFYVGKVEWRVQVGLSGMRSRDADNTLGFSEQAFNGHDHLDRPEPPSMGNRRYLFFSHEDWKQPITEYASDIRRFWRDENVFHIGIAPGDEPVKINWRGVDNLSGVYLFVVRPDSGFQITDKQSIELGGAQETEYLNVFASQDKNFLERFPMQFNMASPYPNPFNPIVNLKYTIPYRWNKNGMMNTDAYHVSIRIFDARGRVVRTLVNRNHKPGNYKVTWFGKSNAGRIVASGAYFCSITAGKFKDVKRLTMIR